MTPGQTISMRVAALIALLVVALPVPAWPQAPAVVAAQPAPAGSAPEAPRASRDASEQAPVSVRLDVIFSGPGGAAPRLRLDVGGQSWVAQLERLDTAGGFRSWVGFIEGIAHSHVVFTERAGVVSGLINAVGISYRVSTVRPGHYVITPADSTRAADDRVDAAFPDASPASRAAGVAAAPDDGSVFDLLMLYTPAARARVGGTAQAEALVAQIVSDVNTSFARSGIRPRVRLVAALEFDQVEAPQMFEDLSTVADSPQARMLRDLGRADLVQLLVSSPDLSSCGLGYQLPSLFEVDFDAYSVADVDCVSRYTPAHEMAHNMGAHHAPEDGAFGALFPYSHGYKDPERRFRTLMAYNCFGADCPRIAAFSNPALTYLGAPTGAADRDNARTINDAAYTVANFRASAGTTPVPVAAPTGLRSNVAGALVTVSWTPVAVPLDSVSYVLQVGSTPGAANLYNATLDVTSAAGVVAPGTYYWRVIALSRTGASAPSAEAQFSVGPGCQTPAPPVLQPANVSASAVVLSWTPTTDPSAVYIVEAGSAPGLADLLSGAVGPVASVTATAAPGTYYVRVRAQNACGLSGASNERVIVVSGGL